MNPKVTVIMPAYNREKFIAESIESVLNQTLEDLELIIVDDGSTDGTLKVAEPFASDPRVNIVKNDEHLGIAGTRNKALKLAKSEYIAPLDSDDIWLEKEKLEKQVAYMDSHPECAILGGSIRQISPDGKEIKEVYFPESDSALRLIVLQFNPFAQSTLMYRKSAILEAGGYSPEYQVCDDYALWLTVGRKHKFANLNEVVTGYRIHGGNITRTKRLTTAREIFEIVKANKTHYPRFYMGIIKAYLRLMITFIRT